MAKKKSSKTGFKLTFTSKRNTPIVSKPGTKVKPKKGAGKVTKTRRATKAEAKQLRKGKWLRVDSKGKKAGQKGYKGKKNKGQGPSKSARSKAKRTKSRRSGRKKK